MATNGRLSQLCVEVLNSGTEDLRLSQLCVEVLSLNQSVETVRVTETGANSAQQSGETRVTQSGASSAQQSLALYVTQIGLLVIYGTGQPEPPPPVPPQPGCPIPAVPPVTGQDACPIPNQGVV